MNIRKPIVAGQFYPAAKVSAQAALDECLAVNVDEHDLPRIIVGGIVPHAGWMCSGMVAGKVFRAIAMRGEVETFVLYGAVHRYGVNRPSVYPSGVWETPLGQVAIDERLASEVLLNSNLFRGDPDAHQLEHSIEVEVPFIQRLFPQAKILPVMTPPTLCAEEAGQIVGETIVRTGIKAVCIGSTDFTHYGPSYRFTPHGCGREGLRWAKDVNDHGLLERIERMDPDSAIEYAEHAQAACGSGAIAASIASAVAMGANKVKVLEHTTSFEVLGSRFGDRSDDSVGYAGIVFGID